MGVGSRDRLFDPKEIAGCVQKTQHGRAIATKFRLGLSTIGVNNSLYLTFSIKNRSPSITSLSLN